jgi:hypothetical protein
MAMMVVALLGTGLAAYGEAASRAHDRAKLAELRWIGGQFQEAIGLYYQRTPGTAKTYPARLEDLVEDSRFLSRQRYLRRIYRDPFTGNADWGLVPAPQGGIMGIYSLADGRPGGEFVYVPAPLMRSH